MSPKRLEDMYDAVIVGAGAAGLSAALGLLRSPEITELKEQGVDPKILVVSKLQPLRSHTGSAEGGIARAWAMWSPMTGTGITTTPSRAATGWWTRMRPNCSPNTRRRP